MVIVFWRDITSDVFCVILVWHHDIGWFLISAIRVRRFGFRIDLDVQSIVLGLLFHDSGDLIVVSCLLDVFW